MKRLELNSESTVKEALELVFPKRRSRGENNNGKFIDVGKQKFIEEFVKFEKLYIEKAKCNKLYEIYNIIPDPLHIGNYDFTYKELKDKLYNSKQESIRGLLPTVKNPRGTRTICPICEDVMMSVKKKSIEHILPKSKAPHFIVTPVNLIIACQSCNGFEHQNNSKSPETSEVNPYFDFFDIREYLEVEFVKSIDGLTPKIVLKEIVDERDLQIQHYIDIYNLLITYSEKVEMAFNDILLKIHDNILLKIHDINEIEAIQIIVETEKEEYYNAYIKDGEWIHDNYFGYLVSKKLMEELEHINQIILKQAKYIYISVVVDLEHQII